MIPPPIEYELDDGRKVLIRDVRPIDRERVRQAYLAASESTIYQRFFSVRPALSETELTQLTQVDQKNHVAWGAVDLADDSHPGVGIARFVRDADNPQSAEIALAVADGWQGVGLGRILLAVLYQLASENDVNRLWGVTLFENYTLARWFRDLGAEVTNQVDCHKFSLPISNAFDDFPPTASAENFVRLLQRLQSAWERSD